MIILGYHNISFFLTLSSLRIYIIQAGLSQVISGWIQTRPNSSQVFVYLSK